MLIHPRRASISAVLLAAAFAGCSEPAPELEPLPPVRTQQRVVVAEVRPPPLAGGTLLVTADGARAYVSDPDRDRVVAVDLARGAVLESIELEPGDEPGRLVEDRAGRVHVALRGGGAVVTIDPSSKGVRARRSICAAPRGLAVAPAASVERDALIVACATGELVTTSAAPFTSGIYAAELEPDLRDVVVTEDGTRLVSTFRSATVLAVDPSGRVLGRARPRDYENAHTHRRFAPDVAYRMVPLAGGAAMIHQRAANVTIDIGEGAEDGYGAADFDCDTAVVSGAVTRFDARGRTMTEEGRGGLGALPLAVDVAVGPVGDAIAFVSAGAGEVGIAPRSSFEDHDGCDESFVRATTRELPDPVAVAFAKGGDRLAVQLREPPAVVVLDATSLEEIARIDLGGPSRADSGWELFHKNGASSTALACASCHPEGREDGHVWHFSGIGARRTQSLEGGVMGAAPFHWDGDQRDLAMLMDTVFVHRMGGADQSRGRIDALASYLDAIPRVPARAVADADRIERGRALFERGDTGCASCHDTRGGVARERFAVGRGPAVQAPSLAGVRNRAPFMHDGCAASLEDRLFDPACGGASHGDLRALSEGDVADLVAYLESL